MGSSGMINSLKNNARKRIKIFESKKKVPFLKNRRKHNTLHEASPELLKSIRTTIKRNKIKKQVLYLLLTLLIISSPFWLAFIIHSLVK